MSGSTDQFGGDRGDVDERAVDAEAMRQLHHELASAPPIEVIAQALAHLATFAYVRLGVPEEDNAQYRDLNSARVLIDSISGMLSAVEGRLGPGENQLREALAALQMTYAALLERQGAEAGQAGAEGQAGAPGQRAQSPPPPQREEERIHRPRSGLWVPGQD
jgi:uncharacterized protein DUF1844